MLAAMPPRPPECISVGMAGDSRHVLVPPYHQGVIRHVHLGRGAVDVGRGGSLLRSFAMSTTMAASGCTLCEWLLRELLNENASMGVQNNYFV